jgi:translation initiation factor IF-3
MRKVCKFLKEGHRVKITLRFRGREMIYKERGEMILKRIAQEVQDFSRVDSPPSVSGRSIEQYLIPKPAK